MREKFRLIQVKCRGGCGKTVTTGNRSLIGADLAHKKFAGYCSDCLPISEDEIVRIQAREFLGVSI